MDLLAKITGIKYKPFLCAQLKSFAFNELELALSTKSAFILDIDKDNSIAISWWVSAKRTRSYPYARVYDTLNFLGKKITIIPVLKDEGKDGDRDFLQWDTISLMSLLGIYVIIGYYVKAEPSNRYLHKITHQRFDHIYTKRKIEEILSYHSGALHWNLSQINGVGEIGEKALESYERITEITGVQMHSKTTAKRRIEQLKEGKDMFMSVSRQLAEKAQRRESITDQPKEQLTGTKGIITIQNYLGGLYYLTVDEVEVMGNDIYLIEGKHSKGSLPSVEDIKDGLIKMILFTNLEDVKIYDKCFNSKPILKLTIENEFNPENLNNTQKSVMETLKIEARSNVFEVRFY